MQEKRRLLLAAGTLATVGAVVALVFGVTFGLFSATSDATQSTFASGTVSIGTPVTDTSCTISDMVPGDESTGYSGAGITGNTQATKDASCEFKVTYTGSVPAFIGIKLTSGGTGLYSSSDSNSLRFEISDGAHSYTTSGNLNADGTILYVATDAGGVSGGTYDFTVDYGLPTAADNTYQDLTASLDMTVYAVQSGNNGYATTDGTSGGTACTVGQTCAGITSWS